MKDEIDTKTVELFPAPVKRRGRPVSGHAKSDAERSREYRLRKKAAPAKPDIRDAEIKILREKVQHLEQALAEANQEIGRLTHPDKTHKRDATKKNKFTLADEKMHTENVRLLANSVSQLKVANELIERLQLEIVRLKSQ